MPTGPIVANFADGYQLETMKGFRSRILGNARDVRVASWKRRQRPAYRSLLVLNDGQDMEALGILNTLGTMADSGEIIAPMVVAIPANRNRMMEYGISGRPDSRGRGALAGAYAQFVLKELLPAVGRRFKRSF